MLTCWKMKELVVNSAGFGGFAVGCISLSIRMDPVWSLVLLMNVDLPGDSDMRSAPLTSLLSTSTSSIST